MHYLYRTGIALLVLGLSACATMTSSKHLAEPYIQDNNSLAKKLGLERDYDFAKAIDNIELHITEQPLANGNRVTLLIDGPSTHYTQLKAIAEAQHHVHLEMYIFTDEKIGEQYAQALSERAQAGVQVRLIYDSLGSINSRWRFLPQLKKAGVQLREFNSVNLIKDPRIWRSNRRNHRKMLVVDGRKAFIGGVNISDDYRNSSRNLGWRDTHIQVQGPAVAQFQFSFFDNWNSLNPDIAPGIDAVMHVLDPLLPNLDELKTDQHYFPKTPSLGHEKIRLITAKGAGLFGLFTQTGKNIVNALTGEEKDEHYAIYKSYIAAMLLAKESIWITQAYFAPSDEFSETLQAAAKRGLDVRVLVPGESDVKLMLNASRHYYHDLLAAGVRIYEYDATMMHSKTAVIDGIWSTVGSSNLDYRSFIHNDEANAVILGKSFGQQMRLMFSRDIKNATEIELEAWKKRPWSQKAKQAIAAAFKYWL